MTEEKIAVLYISYDGMTDNLGQSQVIPYLVELSKRGFDIHILSAEKEQIYEKRKGYFSNLLIENNISWHPVQYTKTPPVISTMKDVFILKKKAEELHKQIGFKIVHCRSYIAAFAGLYLKKKYGVRFLFDMRGFYADERVDGKLWNKSNPIYYAVYKYFKLKEKTFLKQADYIISLTYAGRDIIHSWHNLDKVQIEVIPCCADTQLFDYQKVDICRLASLRSELALSEGDFVVTYLGSLGTWYMADEMINFFKILKKYKSTAKLLFISRDSSEEIFSLCEKHNVSRNDVIIKPSDRENVPYYIAIGNVSLFFIKPVFSKKASSPTKLAELLGMGMPVVCNGNVGDLDKFMSERPFGLITTSFDSKLLEILAQRIDELSNYSPEYLRQISLDLFSLEIGAERYYNVYCKLL